MKRIFFILCLAIASILSYSCFGETCTAEYGVVLKIDGKKDDKVSIKYIGPDKRNYKKGFRFSGSEENIPHNHISGAGTVCNTEDFRKHNNYDFLEMKNLSAESIYVCAVLNGPEIDRIPDYYRYASLLKIYGKQDQDPNYDYTKDKQFEGVKLDYVDRHEFYEQLIKDKYPYIIKLEPQQTCIMK